VIAGTSAGGINGLLLAAAIEAGTEFPETAARPCHRFGQFESRLTTEFTENTAKTLSFRGLLRDLRALRGESFP